MSNQPKQQPEPPAFRRPVREIIADLSREIPERLLSQRKQGGNSLTYIPWSNAIKLLHWYAPGFSYQVVSVGHVASLVFVVARITIPAAEGDFIYESTGSESDEEAGYGNSLEKAESAGLRRAASKAGLGLYLYQK